MFDLFFENMSELATTVRFLCDRKFSEVGCSSQIFEGFLSRWEIHLNIFDIEDRTTHTFSVGSFVSEQFCSYVCDFCRQMKACCKFLRWPEIYIWWSSANSWCRNQCTRWPWSHSEIRTEGVRWAGRGWESRDFETFSKWMNQRWWNLFRQRAVY